MQQKPGTTSTIGSGLMRVQAIAHPIGQFLNFRFLIMVREQDGMALLLELQYLLGDSAGG